MFAVIKTGGKQYLVEPGKKIRIEKLNVSEGSMVAFSEVLLVGGDGNITIGTPLVEGAAVEGNIQAQGREKKLIVFRYHPKTRYRKKRGHRQPFTEVEITKISH